MSSTENLKIPLQEILSATNGFAKANRIGIGGFGTVYRGESVRRGLLAIKQLNDRHGQGDHEYGMEVQLLSKYEHENLSSLIGYCAEGDERILVYKYEANGSLDKVLHRKDLSWMLRLQICLGAARGLRFLHDETRSGVIHRDIKSSNILLDENWKAKISDFGFSKVTLTNSPDSFVFTCVCGTLGYVDPEYMRDGTVTQKSNVYSFGVVLYEVLFGKLVGQFSAKMAQQHYETKTLDTVIDPDLRNQMNSDSLSMFSTIAYQCLNEHSKERPAMSFVVEALEKALRYQQAPTEYLHDVYISFKDQASLEYVYHLCDALKREGLSTYKDTIKTAYDESVSLSAIKQSRSFIIVFSKNFAANSWNLDEVAEIMQCVKERGSVVIPVYGDVYPSQVREQKGYFGKAMSKHNSDSRMGVWRNALIEATNVPCLERWNFNSHEDLAKEAAARIQGQLLGKRLPTQENALDYQQGSSREGFRLSSSGFLYDVYVSFSIQNPQTDMVHCLYDALEREGLSTYKDNIKSFDSELVLLSTISQSRSFIIIFSTNFAANSWYLYEVAAIMECVKERGSIVLPVFGDVYPSQVRELKGYFGRAMSNYDTHPNIQVWRNALVEETNVPGLERWNFM